MNNFTRAFLMLKRKLMQRCKLNGYKRAKRAAFGFGMWLLQKKTKRLH